MKLSSLRASSTALYYLANVVPKAFRATGKTTTLRNICYEPMPCQRQSRFLRSYPIAAFPAGFLLTTHREALILLLSRFSQNFGLAPQLHLKASRFETPADAPAGTTIDRLAWALGLTPPNFPARMTQLALPPIQSNYNAAPALMTPAAFADRPLATVRRRGFCFGSTGIPNFTESSSSDPSSIPKRRL